MQFFQARQDFFRMYVEEIGARVGAPKSRRTLCGTMIDRQTRIMEKLVAGARWRAARFDRSIRRPPRWRCST